MWYVGFYTGHFNKIVSFFKVLCHKKKIIRKELLPFKVLTCVITSNKIKQLIIKCMDFILLQKNGAKKNLLIIRLCLKHKNCKLNSNLTRSKLERASFSTIMWKLDFSFTYAITVYNHRDLWVWLHIARCTWYNLTEVNLIQWVIHWLANHSYNVIGDNVFKYHIDAHEILGFPSEIKISISPTEIIWDFVIKYHTDVCEIQRFPFEIKTGFSPVK